MLQNTQTSRTKDQLKDHGGSLLLKLLPELRNQIWRYAIVEKPIKIRPNHPPPQQPSLVQVCRQTRQEAIGMHYKENLFMFLVEHMDASLYLKWCASSGDRRGCKMSCRFSTRTKPVWDNVLKWMEASYHLRCGGLSWQDLQDVSPANAVAKLYEVTMNLRRLGVSWDDVKVQLECMHLALAAANGDWK